MPNLLYIDTSGKTATVAVSQNGQPPVVQHIADAHEQAAALNTVISEVINAAGIGLNQVDAIAVCAGPGSYTGLRVGVSTAKGLAYALEKPLMLFSNLDLIAAQYSGRGALVVALKARAGEYFYARYDADGNPVDAPAHRFEQEIAHPEGTLLITDEPGLFPDASRVLLDAAMAVDLPSWAGQAAMRFAAGQFDDLAYSEPFYLKAAYTTQSKK